jgi:hypothetical protein
MQARQAEFSWIAQSAIVPSYLRQSVLSSRKRHSPTGTPLTSQDQLRQTHFKQQPEFSLLKTTYLDLCFSYPEHGNISKPVRLIQEASALLFLRLWARVVQTTSIIKEKEGLWFY